MNLSQKKARPNSSYWLKKADEAFMSQFRGLPCEFCGVTDGTVFHHIVPKRFSKALRFDRRNGIILCQNHHKWSRDMAVHSDSVYVVEKWNEYFKEHFRERYEWCKANRRLEFRYTYQEAFEAFKEGQTEWRQYG